MVIIDALHKTDMHTPIEQFLLQFQGEEIVYFPNPGNAGDSVIASATYQVLDRLGLRYITPRFGRYDLKDRIVIYGGGGNLVGPGSFSSRLMGATHAEARRFVVLPQTVKAVTPLLQACGTNVDIICREAVSYEYVRNNAPRAQVHLMDDMAFSLDVGTLLNSTPEHSPLGRLAAVLRAKACESRNVPALSDVFRTFGLRAMNANLKQRRGEDTLYCFRTDGEKTDIPLPLSNIDLSEVFKFGVETKDVAYLSARSVFNYLAQFKTVHTNRLHMAISSALLGLDVRFYANDYYKCRAVYEQSLRERFTNVRWMENPSSVA